jgi:hypothetical protein
MEQVSSTIANNETKANETKANETKDNEANESVPTSTVPKGESSNEKDVIHPPLFKEMQQFAF